MEAAEEKREIDALALSLWSGPGYSDPLPGCSKKKAARCPTPQGRPPRSPGGQPPRRSSLVAGRQVGPGEAIPRPGCVQRLRTSKAGTRRSTPSEKTAQPSAPNFTTTVRSGLLQGLGGFRHVLDDPAQYRASSCWTKQQIDVRKAWSRSSIECPSESQAASSEVLRPAARARRSVSRRCGRKTGRAKGLARWYQETPSVSQGVNPNASGSFSQADTGLVQEQPVAAGLDERDGRSRVAPSRG